MLKAVSSHQVFAAVINRDIASYLPEQKLKDLAMVYTIYRPVPVRCLYMATIEENLGGKKAARNNITCYNGFRQDIVDSTKHHYYKSVHVSISLEQ